MKSATDRNHPSAEEAQTAEAIEIYRAEHTTWDLNRLRKVFADNPTVWLQAQPYVGREAVDGLLMRWASKPRQMEMIHGRVIIQGSLAAVEWKSIGKNADGTPIDMEGSNIYELEDGKIKYLAIYHRK